MDGGGHGVSPEKRWAPWHAVHELAIATGERLGVVLGPIGTIFWQGGGPWR